MGWTKNFRKPEGFLGRFLINSMNKGHTPISRWGLSHYQWNTDTVALDVGCGGGMNVKRMLRLCLQGKAAGIDISPDCVEISRRVNAKNLGTRCEIVEAGAEDIPFADESFDIVTAFETIYFWPEIRRCFGEILRVLRPGGTFLAVCEMSDPHSFWNCIVEGMHIYTPGELGLLFKECGFLNVSVDDTRRDWLCVSGRKPE